jgi:major intracellular serine protease
MLWSKLLILLSFFWSVNTYGFVRIAIIDTGLDLNDPRFTKVLCPESHIDFTGKGITDYNGHGTHVAGLIKQYAGDHGYCMVIIKYYNEADSGERNYFAMINALSIIAQLKVDFVNISGGGTEYWEYEKILIESNPNTTFVVAAGNDGKWLGKHHFFPCSYNVLNMICVGSISRYGRTKFTNYGKVVTAWENGLYVKSTLPNGYGYMTGTSMSTAIRTGKLVKERIQNEIH